MFKEAHTVRIIVVSVTPLTEEERLEELLKMEIAYNATGRHRIHLDDIKRG